MEPKRAGKESSGAVYPKAIKPKVVLSLTKVSPASLLKGEAQETCVAFVTYDTLGGEVVKPVGSGVSSASHPS